MRAIAGKFAQGGAALAVGAILFFAGCSQSMTGDSKKMMDKDANKGEMMKDDSMKAGDQGKMKDQEMKKSQ